ncbi:Uma2 family endonuclease [Methylicorpusculum sp.]|uniref:Uma2 family endonuclease n=1 Tax=Methylicorpusculum sp. TaxID=2713644 RepID=UPI002730741F|nr:Uma2 family endonuclease [Methylicorpusculum sp.]MDP2177468.1 Uma2 family endonuclease [Methylicorpusculum sp.]MDP3530224.1 Uma2 family endonuclease [Methylicorpusculum sp.]MDZ4154394.1 Uma2 family endonuclease [Methylicorpusculum sp.]
MLRVKPSNISEEDYLQGELTSDVKHELIGGSVFAMAGASANHERICLNISRKFGDHLNGSPCEPFGSDMKVKTGSNYFYPDVIVACNFDESQPYFTETPIIIVEVVSKTTRKTDETANSTHKCNTQQIIGIKSRHFTKYLPRCFVV